ncbi:MAG: NAD-dependent epimerase/dehydratase family protein [Deltaproteobacteria bacterium]|nr:NAD-dependent epimerase/dehydratase family protein [Deltaproteobacteria bacterium]
MTDSDEKQKSPRSVLVTGGGGFLGKAVVKGLLERKDRVFSFSRNRYSDLERLGVAQIQGDLADAKAVDDACRGRDIVFHVAAKAGFWGAYEEYYPPNVLGTKNVIEACRRQGVPLLVHTSSPNVIYSKNGSMEGVDESVPYPPASHNAYQATKTMAEKMVIAAADDHLKTISLRPHLIWGPGDNHLIPRILEWSGKIVRVGDGKNLSDTIYIDNAADAHLLAGDALQKNPQLSGNVYFISQGEPVYLWDMINRILEAGGKPPVARSVSKRTAYLVGAVLELIYKALRLKSEPKMTRFLAHELSSANWYDISAAKRDLGYKPRVSTAEGLEKLKKWLDDATIRERETKRRLFKITNDTDA